MDKTKAIDIQESLKDRVKGWVKRNKKKLIIGGSAVIGVTTIALLAGSRPKKGIESSSAEAQEFDYGRDLEMHFVDPETKEVLWKELCTESCMNDYKRCGMEYEEVRKLNGIEEA